MHRKKRLKSLGWRTYGMTIGVILIFFILIGYFFTDLISVFLVKNMEEESNRLANSYMSRLSNSTAASKIINELLDENLLVANKMILKNQDNLSHNFLKELAEDLMVDEIYWYNSHGEIIYSTTDEYIGWEAEDGHPVYNFIVSDDSYLIEDIRKDSESDKYYKYGYSKLPNGEFIQVGIIAEKVNDLTNRFSAQHFIDDLTGEDNIIYIHLIDNDFKVTSSNDKRKIGTYPLGENEKLAIKEDKEYGAKKSYEDRDVYETLSPIYVDEVKVGTLAVIYSLEGTNVLIRKVSLIALSVLLFLLITHGIMTLIIMNKSNKIENLAYYDPLTNLPNTAYLAECLQEDMENFKDKRALIIINCSNLKLVRLIFGHQGSEDILAEIANKLKSLSFTNNNLFRYSEDSFMVYIDNYKEKYHLVEYSNKIIDSFESSFKKVGGSKFITVKIGIVEIDRNYGNVDKIFKNAEITINNINDKENKSYSFFDESMSEEFMFNEIMERELRKAIYNKDSQELYLEYQPQVDLKTNKIIGFEALARWNSKELGFIPPMKFIDIAEKNQLIIPLGERILRTACQFIKDIENKGYKDIKVAVNISLIQLLQDDFITTVMEIVDKTKIKPESLELEVTETALMDNYEIINEKLSKLREEGINISLDDFGTGYSSLSRLRYLNINIIKIDKYFIDNLFSKSSDELLTGTIITLAHRLGLKVVAEGVERVEQKEYLIENHCDIMQGYLFSKPIKMENAIRLLEDNL